MADITGYRWRVWTDTAANLSSENPILLNGEIAKESDAGLFKIGDGVTAWNSLIAFSNASRLGEMVDFPFSVTDSGVVDLYSTYSKYAVFCNGATLDKSTDTKYTALVDWLRAEAAGDTSHPYYAADANQAVLPDARGRVTRANDSTSLVDTDGPHDIGFLQEDAMQRVTGEILGSLWTGFTGSASGAFTRTAGTSNRAGGGTATTSEYSFDSANSTSPNAAKTNDDETRVKSLITNKIMFYA
jgi:hypothetical protein